MGQKKHKHARRTVAFYKLHHGFKEPFKVGVCWTSTLATAAQARARAPSLVASFGPHTLPPPPHTPLTTPPRKKQVLVDGNFLHATLGAK